MQKFIATTGMMALAANADYQTIKTIWDGQLKEKHLKSHMGAEHEVKYEGWELTMPANSMVVLQDKKWDGPDNHYQPDLRGGSINYWTYMRNMDCGCVAGVYLVAVNDNCNVEQGSYNGDLQDKCPSVDVMQANDYGFELSAHPCENGNCDDKSMCEYKMRKQGAEKYGANAFGKNGTLVNTDNWFNVQTDFVTENDHSELWKIRTTITQDENKEPIVMEAECKDYLEPLNYDLQGQMAIVISNWDNTDGRSDFEKDAGQSPGNCSESQWSIYGLDIMTFGQNEERDDGDDGDGDNGPKPAEWQTFIGYIEEYDEAGDGIDAEFYVKGLNGQFLKAENQCIEIGENNRAFIHDIKWDDSTEWAFVHDTYVGGSLSFDVDLSEVPCQCATGVFLTYLDDEQCHWHKQPVDQPPQCDTIAIMEANAYGFITNHKECESGTCTEPRQCQNGVGIQDATGTYGPGSTGQFDIDTEMPFSVNTQFFVDQLADGSWAKTLERVETTLTQGANVVTIRNQCPDIFEPLWDRLWYAEMGIAVSSYDVGSHSDIAPQCLGNCEQSKAKISNLQWKQETSVNPVPDPVDELIVSEEASEFLSDCDTGCTECVKAWYKNSPNDIFGHCVNDVVYRYGHQCRASQDRSRCSTGEMDYCFKAYPADSDKKWRDPDNKCRSVIEFNRQEDFPWKFGKKNKGNKNSGLCILSDDPNRQCAQAWDENDGDKPWKGCTSMARVRPSS